MGSHLLACYGAETAVPTVDLFLIVNLVPNLPKKLCGWLMAAGAKVVVSADDLLLLSVIGMGQVNQSWSTCSCRQM